MSAISSQSSPSSYNLSFFDLVSPTKEKTTAKKASLPTPFLPIATSPTQSETRNLLQPGTCTVIGCPTKESRRWHRNPESLEKNAKICSKCYMKAWYEKNAEKHKAMNKAWREKNPEKVAAKNRDWHKKNRQTMSTKSKASIEQAKKTQETFFATFSTHTTSNVEISERHWIEVFERLTSEDEMIRHFFNE